MAVTAAVVSGVTAVGGAIYGNQVRQKAKGVTSAAEADVLASRPDAKAQDAAAAANAVNAEQTAKRKAAGRQGYASTILTSPTSAPPPAPVKKTLLGL